MDGLVLVEPSPLAPTVSCPCSIDNSVQGPKPKSPPKHIAAVTGLPICGGSWQRVEPNQGGGYGGREAD